GKEKYILDIGGSSFWKVFFPFLFWIFPLKVYKVNDENLIKEIVAPTVEQKGVGWQTAFVAAISLGGGSLLYPYVKYMDMKISPLISAILILIIFLIIVSFFLYVNIIYGNKLKQHLNLKQYPKKRLWIRPDSKQHFLFILYSYLLLVGLTVLFLGGSIQQPNGFMFFAGSIVLFMAIGLSLITIKVGDTTIKFKEDSE